MRYNTGNPVEPDGSSSPFDLFDNAGNIDKAANGEADTWVDRTGENRKSIRGMEREFDQSQQLRDQEFTEDQADRLAQFDIAQAEKESQFQQFLASSGYQPLGDYAAGINVTTRNQIIRKDGEYYRIAASASLPYTTTGNWAVDSPNFVSVGHAALRQQLASAGGSGLSEYSGRTVEVRLEEIPTPVDKPFGAAGNATTNDSSSFAAFEVVHKGRTVDLGGKTYLVNSTPRGNNYVNGKFKILDATFPAGFFNEFLASAPKFNSYGGQLRSLKEALGNPLVQFVGIAGVGDSILWGRTLPDNSSVTPQTQLLNTARDNASSPSFWNNLRRYIGGQYMKGAALTLSNWAASPSGESVATYVKPLTIYPKDGPFSLTVVGSTQTSASAARATSPTGFMYTLSDGAPGGANYQSIKFNFTGDKFTFIFRATNTGDFINYRLFVNGVDQGSFSTQDGVDGVVSGDNNRRLHSFGYVRNKVIEIRTDSTGMTGVRRLYIEGIEIPKTVRFTNQGVIGQTARTYDLYNLSGSYSSPTAVTAYDQFIFCQFGTNDRGDTSVPPGGAEFERSMQAIITRLTALGEVILMCAGPVADSTEPPAPAYMTMRDVRGVLSKVAKSNSLAFIDNLAAFDTVDPSVILDGTTHPNALGHAVMSRNIINALESQ
ncbi:SGNH/GDSL hydrolase family protein [Pseudomonas sp. 1121_17]|uniref:SGNH/GDSL hydrolase family protein n=1 Tax=Pseudomonas sp. 1121_17 TaxID=2604458 RepID=UPI004064C667